MKKYRFCQSCGMPMKRDPESGGTENDNTRSIKFCSYCYQNGQFTAPEIDTPEKMQSFCIEKMKEQGMPGVVAWLFTRSIPGLERWQKKI